MKKLRIPILFLLFIYIGYRITTDSSYSSVMMLASLIVFGIFTLVTFRSLFHGLILIMAYLPVYEAFNIHFFHHSRLGYLSKDLMLVVFVVFWVLEVMKGTRKLKIPEFYRSYFLFFLIAAVNIVRAPSLKAGLLDFRLWFFYPIAGLAIMNILDSEKKFIKLANILIIESTLIILYSFYQKYIWEAMGSNFYIAHFGLTVAKSFQGNVQVSGTFTSNAVLGIYLDFIIMLSLYLITKKKRSILYFLIIISSIFVMIFTLKRTPWIGLGIIGLFYIFNTKGKARNIAMATMILFTLIVISNEFISNRFQAIVNPFDSYSLNSRFNGMRKVSQNFLNNPLGYGLGQVGLVATSAGGGITDVDLLKFRGYGRVIDNFLLNIALEMGYPGIIFFLIMWVMLFFRVLSEYRARKSILNINAYTTVIFMGMTMLVGLFYNFVALQMMFWVVITPSVMNNYGFEYLENETKEAISK